MTEQEAIEQFKERLPIGDYRKQIPEYYEAMELAVKSLEEIQQYRKLEERLNGISLEEVVDGFISAVEKGTKEGYEYGRILTNEDARDWEEYRAIGTPEECGDAVEKQKASKELESHDEKHILKSCISLMQEMVNEFAEWYRWQHGEDAIEELDEEERFCFRKSYFSIVQELFLIGTNHSGGTSTRAKCEQLGVDSAEEIEFDWSDE